MSTTTFPNLHVPRRLYDDIEHFKSGVVDRVKRHAESKNFNVEFEIRLGQYDGSTFIPGISYEEFSRFYTYLEENCKKVDNQNYLDIYNKRFTLNDKEQVRTTLEGSANIMNYCNTNVLPLNTEHVTFQTKKKLAIASNIDIDIYDMRLSLAQEQILSSVEIMKELKFGSLEEINKAIYDAEKQFRYKKRISYISQDKMFRYDLTQTKQVYDGRSIRYDKSLSTSDVFDQQPVYELEIELLYNGEFSDNLPKIESSKMTDIIVKHITTIMQIRQDTELVISKRDKEEVIKDLMKLYLDKRDIEKEFDTLYNRKDKQYGKIFPGAKVSTLERGNVIHDLTRKEQKPYIYDDYTVTDKADGERFLLFIDGEGFVFLIDDRLNILRTDIRVSGRNKLEYTLLDGELVITFDNDIKVYNYYAFDIIYLARDKIYQDPLFPKSERERNRSRYYKLESVIKDLRSQEIPKINGVSIININIKNYKVINGVDPDKMKQNCDFIWSRREKGFKYELDGLIFTPKYDAYPIGKLWASALKWKPPSENSIDFLIKFVDTENSIQTIVQNDVITKYQLAELYVGDSIEKRRDGTMVRDYVEKKFDIPNTIGSNPTYIIKLPLDSFGKSTGIKDDTVIRSDTIVECVWDTTIRGWKVLRTRLDKTQRYLASGKKISNTANNIAVAISIWTTIVNPITTEMIIGQESTAKLIEDSEYYSKTGSILTECMRGFNNYMKTLLISGARINGGGLIDFSCGRGGDIKKWFGSKYTRVVGLDYSKVGIESLDPRIGAYGRLELSKKNNPEFTEWAQNVKLFWADTSKITTATHPNGVCQKHQRPVLQEALEIPMDVGISFFTAHYYFESPMKIRGFFQNMFDNIKDGGIALVTCFDGLEIFKWLEHLDVGQIYTGLVKSKPVWQVKKGYNKSTPFLDNSANVGLKIDIKFESISEDYYTEYLVHPKYFLKIAEEYGFEVINDSEAKAMYNLKSGTALFGDIITEFQNTDTLKKFRDTELGKVFYRDINSFVNNDDYADLREWNKHNRYFILRKKADGDLPTPKGWRSRLSKFDCEREYTKEVEAEMEKPQPVSLTSAKKAAVASYEEASTTVTQSEEVSATATKTPKKRLVKKATSVVSSQEEPATTVTQSEEVPATATKTPKKLLVKKAKTPVSSEEPATTVTQSEEVQSAATPAVSEEVSATATKTPKKLLVKKAKTPVSSEEPATTVTQSEEVQSAATPAVSEEVSATATKTPKKLLVKKAKTPVSSEEPATTVTQSEEVQSAATPAVSEEVPATTTKTPKKRAAKKTVPASEEAANSLTALPSSNSDDNSKPKGKKKTLVVPPSVLEQLLKGTSETEDAQQAAPETPSELGSVVAKASVGTKIKVPRGLIKKQ
jgi:hypothetical protein